jgi:hypothetical protein
LSPGNAFAVWLGRDFIADMTISLSCPPMMSAEPADVARETTRQPLRASGSI